MQKKHIPLRRCVGCYQSKPKEQLIRVVKLQSKEKTSSEITIDPNGKLPGRGTYLCRDSACLKSAMKARRFERAFSCQIPQEFYQQLEEELNGNKV